MSEKRIHASYSPKSIDTLIGAGVRIEGDIACAGVLRVQGEIVGNVSCEDNPNGALIVDSAGSVTGAVSATHVFVRGQVTGPVRSSDSIEVNEGASLHGDVSFKRLAIHAGGVVEGLLDPTVVEDPLAARPPQTAKKEAATGIVLPEASGGQPGSWSGTRKAAAAFVLAAVVAAGVWVGRNPEVIGRTAGEVALKTEPVLKEATAPVSRRSTAPDESSSAPVSTVAEAQPIAPAASAPIVAQEAAQPAAPAAESSREKSHEKVVAVRGINPSRPASVFLLVSNDASVLYRKKRNESGDGARVSVPGGEKASVAFASDELIRVAQGRDVVILFQGAKVPKQVIESGAWISFVPR